MPVSIVAAFWAVSILFVITPGADWAYTIAAGLRQRAMLPAIAGLLCGHLLATLIVAAGVGALLAKMPSLLMLIAVGGAVYLLWLGVGMVRQPAVPLAGSGGDATSGLRWALKGLCISGLNPKVFLLFLALLPQFTDPSAAWPVSLQMAVLGLLHVLSCGVVYLLVGYCSRALLQTRPAAARRVSRVSGVLMVVIALVLLAEACATA